MNTIFMNLKHNKTSDLHRVILNLSNKITLKRSNKYLLLSNLNSYYIWKQIKSHTKTIKLKRKPQ